MFLPEQSTCGGRVHTTAFRLGRKFAPHLPGKSRFQVFWLLASTFIAKFYTSIQHQAHTRTLQSITYCFSTCSCRASFDVCVFSINNKEFDYLSLFEFTLVLYQIPAYDNEHAIEISITLSCNRLY